MKLNPHLAVLAGFLVGTMISLAPGCWPTPQVVVGPTTTAEAKPEPVKPKVDKPKTVDELEKELAEAKKAEVKAHQEVEAKKQELAEAVTVARQHKLYWMMGILFLAMLGCIAGAVYLAGLRKWFIYGALTCAGLAILCLGVAAILPYMPWVIAGAVTVAALVGLAWWKRDHKAVEQVVTAVEGVKGDLPGYKEKFRQVIDTDVDAWLDRVRSRLGALKK